MKRALSYLPQKNYRTNRKTTYGALVWFIFLLLIHSLLQTQIKKNIKTVKNETALLFKTTSVGDAVAELVGRDSKLGSPSAEAETTVPLFCSLLVNHGTSIYRSFLVADDFCCCSDLVYPCFRKKPFITVLLQTRCTGRTNSARIECKVVQY